MADRNLTEEHKQIIVNGLKRLPNLKSYRYFRYTTPFGEYFEVRDTNDGVYRIGTHYPGIRCPFNEISVRVYKPKLRWDENRDAVLTENAIESFWLETYYPILVLEGRFGIQATYKQTSLSFTRK